MMVTHSQFHAPGKGRSVFIETYGCQMNVADSQLMVGILEDGGFQMADSLDVADVILVNTCAVRERAEERVLAHVASLKPHKVDRGAILGVCGCMAEHLRDSMLERVPIIDLVVGPDAYRRLPQMIDDAGHGTCVIDVKLDRDETYEGAADSKVDGINGWVSIQRGCDKFCSFCIVPFVRGRERSCPPSEVVRQTVSLVSQGAAEVTLLGQTVNSYQYEGVGFADLLGLVSEVDGLKRVRFTSPHPLDFTPQLIETMASDSKVMPHLHLPLQSGSDVVLDRMKRGYGADQYVDLVTSLRAAMPNIALSTDVIVGFPGESDQDFSATMDLVESLRFDSAFMFIYSERSNTFAARNYADDVATEVKKSRITHLVQRQEQISAEINAAQLGNVVEVLVAGPSRRDPSELTGRTDTFKSTVFPLGPISPVPGDLVTILVESATSHTLRGRIADQR